MGGKSPPQPPGCSARTQAIYLRPGGGGARRWAARLHEGPVSSLVERGRDGGPASPEGLLPSRLAGTPPGAATPRTAGQRRRKAPVAHQGGLQRDANGRLQIKDWPTLAASAQ